VEIGRASVDLMPLLFKKKSEDEDDEDEDGFHFSSWSTGISFPPLMEQVPS
jgi:hypothetical protein